jgi:hypothetical protein
VPAIFQTEPTLPSNMIFLQKRLVSILALATLNIFLLRVSRKKDTSVQDIREKERRNVKETKKETKMNKHQFQLKEKIVTKRMKGKGTKLQAYGVSMTLVEKFDQVDDVVPIDRFF